MGEICLTAWGNAHAATKITEIGEKQVTAQAVCWDLEQNVRIAVEVRRRITDKRGNKFNDDMIGVTCNAAASIALRNAIFKVIPRAFVDDLFAEGS